ncbi:hypothetical protein SB768_08020 [Burkholderia sp. SIMBA_043]|uniref:hypothetical protein n=1 Tax=Burkholderia TaxID=32008 RepID=UPI0005D74960|nr:hypothetical protein [Burkholderia vietnamiensis]AJY07569.1 hypothetical protein AK36_2045 [Burkholderia vietnamiensis LMG 10929]AVR17212.1 hypothetical protein A8H33_28655 [Burkholderia vietnamiensis]KVM53883.1 hypothetical protein WJ57_13925 [Burkholderia vietnamiensis]UBI27550.1 hypothetical protein LA325_15320 [Burkholderia vietnamiensis]
MFSTKPEVLNRIDARSLMGEREPLYFVNGICGVGKTFRFLDIAQEHVDNAHPCVLVYAAPSRKLLDQVQADLLARGVDETKIMNIDPIKGVPISQVFQAALMGSKKLGIEAVANGTVLLCTHECIARASSDLGRAKDRVSLVYDEARACLERNYKMVLPREVYAHLLAERWMLTSTGRKVKTTLMEMTKTYSVSDQDYTSIMTWNTIGGLPVPTVAEIEALIPESTTRHKRATDIVEFLEYVRSSSVDVYVSVKTDKTGENYQIAKVFNPIRMFAGYTQVLILSAFFESSQMFHFLNDEGRDEFRPLKDITSKYVDAARFKKLMERLQHVKVTYVFDLNGSSLTKTAMTSGIVVKHDRKASKRQLQATNAEWSRLHSGRAPTYRSAFETAMSGRNSIKRKGSEEVEKLLTGIKPNVLETSVIRYMVSESLKLYTEWARQENFGRPGRVKVKRLCVGVNAKYKLDNQSEASKVWEAEELATHFPGKLRKLPMVAHGLNKWKHYNGAAFLATMQYGPEDKEFLKRVAPGYSSDVDRTLDYALQVLFRIAARDADSKEPCLFIVTDRRIAEELSARFQAIAKSLGVKLPGRVLGIYEPLILNSKCDKAVVLQYEYRRTAEEERKHNAARAKSPKGKLEAALKKVWLQTPGGKRHNALTVQISRLKKAGSKFWKEFNERSTIPTYAEWKRTPAGVKAAKKLTSTQA